MPAPDFETLYDVESAVESAFKAVLTANGLPAFMQRESGNLPAARVDVQCQLGGELGNHRAFNNAGEPMADVWQGTIRLLVTTPRFNKDGSDNPTPFDPAAHGRMRGKLRYLLQMILDSFDQGVLPYHIIVKLTAA